MAVEARKSKIKELPLVRVSWPSDLARRQASPARWRENRAEFTLSCRTLDMN